IFRAGAVSPTLRRAGSIRTGEEGSGEVPGIPFRAKLGGGYLPQAQKRWPAEHLTGVGQKNTRRGQKLRERLAGLEKKARVARWARPGFRLADPARALVAGGRLAEREEAAAGRSLSPRRRLVKHLGVVGDARGGVSDPDADLGEVGIEDVRPMSLRTHPIPDTIFGGWRVVVDVLGRPAGTEDAGIRDALREGMAADVVAHLLQAGHESGVILGRAGQLGVLDQRLQASILPLLIGQADDLLRDGSCGLS